jgi:uncharacterized protein YciI
MKKYILVLTLLAIHIGASAQNKSYTFVFLNNKPDKEVLSKEKSDSIMTGHMNNIGRLAKEGKLLAAGPFEGGGGIFVLNTGSTSEAKEWLSTDPGVKAKRWDIEIFPFTPTIGSVCAVGEKYEMVFYQFVRIFPHDAISSESSKQHDKYIKKLKKEGSILAAGLFGKYMGEVFVLKADAVKETINADPAVKSGDLKFEMKKLYIAKGSFCEK